MSDFAERVKREGNRLLLGGMTAGLALQSCVPDTANTPPTLERSHMRGTLPASATIAFEQINKKLGNRFGYLAVLGPNGVVMVDEAMLNKPAFDYRKPPLVIGGPAQKLIVNEKGVIPINSDLSAAIAGAAMRDLEKTTSLDPTPEISEDGTVTSIHRVPKGDTHLNISHSEGLDEVAYFQELGVSRSAAETYAKHMLGEAGAVVMMQHWDELEAEKAAQSGFGTAGVHSGKIDARRNTPDSADKIR